MANFLSDEIIASIKTNSERIVEQITQEDIDIYCIIQEQFKNSRGNIVANTIFKYLFKNYYFRRNLYYYSNEFFKNYFSKFSEQTLQERIIKSENINEIIKEILEALYKKNDKLNFSYTTKMIHTINPEYPIYDSNVVNALKLKSYYKKDKEKRIDQYLKNYNEIHNIYNQIILKGDLNEIIDEFSKTRDISKLNNIKILDYIFWSVGKKNS